MSMLEKDYEGSICEVKTLKNEFLLAGHITRISEEGIEISDPSGPLPIYAYKTPVKVSVFNSHLGFRMLAGQIYMSNREMIRVVNALDFLDYEKRRFFRVDTDASAFLLQEQHDGEGEPAEPIEHPIRVLNISLCGIMFSSQEKLRLGDQKTIRMALYKSVEEDMRVIIHRIKKHEDNAYVYGCEVVALDKRAEQNLCAYLFEQQRQQIKRKKQIE